MRGSTHASGTTEARWVPHGAAASGEARREWQVRWKRMPRERRWLTVGGGAVVLVAMAVAAVAPPLWMEAALVIRTDAILQGPSWRHPLGTDQFGRDVFIRLLVGTRPSVVVAFGAVGCATVVGTTLGVLVGTLGGRADHVAMRVADVLFAFPGLLLAMAVMAVVGPSLTNLVLVLGLVYTPQFMRVARASALAVRGEQYVEAAEAMGASRWRVVARHVAPNAMAPVVVQISVGLSLAVLSESALSFLGLGIQPPVPSWGNMLSEGRQFMEIAPWNAVAPGLAIAVVVLGFNLLGDGLQELLDPRLRAERA